MKLYEDIKKAGLCVRCLTDKRYGRHGLGLCPMEPRSCGFQVNADRIWNFVDNTISRNPIQIHSKRQWSRLLKKHNLTDDVKRGAPLTDIRKRPFDRKWDSEVTKAIQQSIAEVKKKPHSTIGKKFTQSEMKSILKRDSIRQQKEKKVA